MDIKLELFPEVVHSQIMMMGIVILISFSLFFILKIFIQQEFDSHSECFALFCLNAYFDLFHLF